MYSWKNKKIDNLNRKKVVTNAGAYTILGLSVLAMTFFGVCTPDGGYQGPKGSAAKVGDEVISANEFRRAYQNTRSRLQQQYGENFDPAKLPIASQVMSQLVRERASFVRARELGVQATEDEALEAIKDVPIFKGEKGEFSSENFANFLRGNRYSEASFLGEIKRSLTVNKLRQLLVLTSYAPKKAAEAEFRITESKIDVSYVKISPQSMTVEVSEEEVDKFLDDAGKAKVKNFYESNSSRYNSPEKRKARHILIGYKGSRNATPDGEKRTKEGAKNLAEKVLQEVKKPGADFAAIARRETDEATGKASGGDLGFFKKEDMAPAVSEAIWSLSEGQVGAQVVESPFGFHVVKLEKVQKAVNRTLEEVTREIAKSLLTKQSGHVKARELADQLVESLKSGKPVDTLLKDNGLSWQATGPTSLKMRYIPGLGSDAKFHEAILSLSKEKPFFEEVVQVSGNLYVFKWGSTTLANFEELNSDTVENLSDTSAARQGFALFNSIGTEAVKELEDKGRIWRNPEYLSLDQPNQGT